MFNFTRLNGKKTPSMFLLCTIFVNIQTFLKINMFFFWINKHFADEASFMYIFNQ